MIMAVEVWEQVREVVLSGAGALAAVAIGYVIQYLRQLGARLAAQQRAEVIWSGVHAAEQLIGPGRGDAKLAYVRELLVTAGYNPGDAVIGAEVEAAVRQLTGD